jgi:hypothetical protein
MTDDELQHLADNFDTATLLETVDQIDLLRGHLNDGDGFAPPEIRTNLLKLHGLAMDVVNNGFVGRAPALFDLANDLSDQVFDMMEALQKVQEALDKLTDLCPEDLDCSDVDDASADN